MRTRFVRPIISLFLALGVVSALGVVPEVAEGRCTSSRPSALAMARSIVPVADVCFRNGSELTVPLSPAGSGPVCAEEGIVNDDWPQLPQGYYWELLNEADESFAFAVRAEGCPSPYAVCSIEGCELVDASCRSPQERRDALIKSVSSKAGGAIMLGTLAVVLISFVATLRLPAHYIRCAVRRMRDRSTVCPKFAWHTINWLVVFMVSTVCLVFATIFLAGLGC